MSENTFFAEWSKTAENSSATVMPKDFIGAVNFVSSRVDNFLSNTKLGVTRTKGSIQSVVANEAFSIDTLAGQVSPSSVLELCRSCGVSKANEVSAVKQIGAILASCYSNKGNNSAIWNSYRRTSASPSSISMESLFPKDLIASISNDKGIADLEAFGMNMDTTAPDIKLGIVVTLMQNISSITARLFPIIPTSQSAVTIKREECSVVDMSNVQDKPARMIDLYRNPAKVVSSAKRAIPLAANDTDGDFLVADEQIKFGVTADLHKLCLVANKPGWEKFNHTDYIADNVLLESVIIELSTPAGEGGTPAAVSEKFLIKIPQSRGRFTRKSDTERSTTRYCNIVRYQYVLTNATPKIPTAQSNTTTSSILGTLTASEGIMLTFNIDANIDLEFTNAFAQATMRMDAYSRIANVEPSTACQTLVTKLSGDTPELVAYVLDAKYSEQNMRKTTARTRIDFTSMEYNIPEGRAIVVDWAQGQDVAGTAAARLAQLEAIGRDARNLNIFETVSDNVADEQKMYNENPDKFETPIGYRYAAGSIVNPYVFVDSLDLADVVSVRSSDAAGDLKQYILNFLNSVVSKMLYESMFKQQLAQDAIPKFRMVTTEKVKGMCLQLHLIHAHLDATTAATGGAEYVIPLACGAIIEVVTTTFGDYDDKMILVPWMDNAESVLNFGKNFDMGTMVGTYQSSHDGLLNRMFSTARDMLIPTNVLAAKISVTNMSSVAWLFA